MGQICLTLTRKSFVHGQVGGEHTVRGVVSMAGLRQESRRGAGLTVCPTYQSQPCYSDTVELEENGGEVGQRQDTGGQGKHRYGIVTCPAHCCRDYFQLLLICRK